MKSDHSKMLVYLKGISNKGLQQVLDFLYNGEVSIDQENMNDFLETCKELEVKGLYDKFTKTDTQSTEKREMNEHGKNKENSGPKNIGNLEDDLGWRTTFSGRQPLVEDNLGWKMTFGGRRPLVEDVLQWKTAFDGSLQVGS